MAVKGLLAIRRDNAAPLAICEVTVQGWQHRETVDGETFRARYFTERERDVMESLLNIVRVLTPTDPSKYDADDERSRIATAKVLLIRAIDKITEE